jgi:penicillin-binding protein A
MTLGARLWHIVNISLVLLLLLSLRLVYWPMLRAHDLQPVVLDPQQAARQYTGAPHAGGAGLEALPQPVIQRSVAALANVQRGRIIDRTGHILAASEPNPGGGSVRVYSEPSLAHTVGYVSGFGVGVSGIENNMNQTLLGLDRFDTQLPNITRQNVAGSDVHLTLDHRLQRAAAAALGQRPGSVVVLDARSGAVLALANWPVFDPNRILEPGYLRGLVDECGDAPGCQGILLNRATQGLYVPGSTWKTVTLIAALDSGLAARDTVFDLGPPLQGADGRPYFVYRVDGGTIEDRNHTMRRLNLDQAFARSANAVFARLGDELGGERLLDYAGRLGFSTPRGAPPIEVAASVSRSANAPAELITNNLLRAASAIGQGEVLATPLNMALVAAAVINDGHVPAPHLLLSVRHPDGHLLAGEPRGNWVRGAMRPATAHTVRQMMIFNVSEGTASRAALPGAIVGGKTGTAQLSGGLAPHAWFAGFAENERHTLAIAVLVEHGGSGAQVAVPLFAQVAEAALAYLDQPITNEAAGAAP